MEESSIYNSQKIDNNFPAKPPVGDNKSKLKWVVVGFLALLNLVLFSVVIISLYSLLNKSIAPTDNQGNISVEQKKDDNKISVLYALRQFDPEIRKIYKTDINNQNKTEISIPIEENSNWSLRFIFSRDNQYVASAKDKLLSVSETKKLDFKKVAETTEVDTRISSVLWSSDSTKIAYSILKFKDPCNEHDCIEWERMFIVNRDGTDKKLIGDRQMSFRGDSSGGLSYFDSSKDELYWRDPIYTGKSITYTVESLSDGSIKKIKESDFDLLFPAAPEPYSIVEGKKIVKYDLLKNNERTLYQLDDTGKNYYGIRTHFENILLSPDRNSIVFSIKKYPEDKSITHSIDLLSGKMVTLLDDVKYHNISPTHWSPDGKYIWFESYCPDCGFKKWGYDNDGEVYIMDMESKSLKLFFKGTTKAKEYIPSSEDIDREPYREIWSDQVVNERIEFISWLVD